MANDKWGSSGLSQTEAQGLGVPRGRVCAQGGFEGAEPEQSPEEAAGSAKVLTESTGRGNSGRSRSRSEDTPEQGRAARPGNESCSMCGRCQF